ncbi:hypothetical protein NDU88_003775 [Pleurodeles waltl]|uniref:Secreted protein n=1 Tax=Pleurodeles waltl TaxID=8319 RepID=A0AAV7KXE5_PLEWA|nr:hypothetical protein NDU88_003775 [Pleurodeles waltl]
MRRLATFKPLITLQALFSNFQHCTRMPRARTSYAREPVNGRMLREECRADSWAVEDGGGRRRGGRPVCCSWGSFFVKNKRVQLTAILGFISNNSSNSS